MSIELIQVDAMLGAYMDDLCLQPENLEVALSQIRPSVRSAALQVGLNPDPNPDAVSILS